MFFIFTIKCMAIVWWIVLLLIQVLKNNNYLNKKGIFNMEKVYIEVNDRMKDKNVVVNVEIWMVKTMIYLTLIWLLFLLLWWWIKIVREMDWSHHSQWMLLS